MEALVNIYIKISWHGALRGSGTAAALIVFDDSKGQCHKKLITTKVDNSTKDRLQLQAVTKAIHALKCPCSIGVYIDSTYIKQAIEQSWPQQWKKAGWKNKKGREPKNRDVWEYLLPLLKRHRVGIVSYIPTFDKELKNALTIEQ